MSPHVCGGEVEALLQNRRDRSIDRTTALETPRKRRMPEPIPRKKVCPPSVSMRFALAPFRIEPLGMAYPALPLSPSKCYLISLALCPTKNSL